MKSNFCALRVAEYKFVARGTSEDDTKVVNAISETVLESYPTPHLFNMYLDPREEHSFFSGQTFMDNLFSDPLNAHVATFQEYPGKKATIKAKIDEFLQSK